MNMLVTVKFSIKSSKGSVFAMEWTSSKRKSFEKKKEVYEKTKGRRKKEEKDRAEEEGR